MTKTYALIGQQDWFQHHVGQRVTRLQAADAVRADGRTVQVRRNVSGTIIVQPVDGPEERYVWANRPERIVQLDGPIESVIQTGANRALNGRLAQVLAAISTVNLKAATS